MNLILKVLKGIIKFVNSIIDFILRVSKNTVMKCIKERRINQKIGKKLKNTKFVIDDNKEKLQKNYEQINNLKAQLSNKNDKIKKLENQLKIRLQEIEKLKDEVQELKSKNI